MANFDSVFTYHEMVAVLQCSGDLEAWTTLLPHSCLKHFLSNPLPAFLERALWRWAVWWGFIVGFIAAIETCVAKLGKHRLYNIDCRVTLFPMGTATLSSTAHPWYGACKWKTLKCRIGTLRRLYKPCKLCLIVSAKRCCQPGHCPVREHTRRLGCRKAQEKATGKWLFCHFQLTRQATLYRWRWLGLCRDFMLGPCCFQLFSLSTHASRW